MSIRASTGALLIAIVATAVPELLRRSLLPRSVKRHYDEAKAVSLTQRGFMVEAFAVWWADLSALVVAWVSCVGAVAFTEGWRRVLTVLLLCLVTGFIVEALIASPFEYEANSSVQRVVSMYRERRDLRHDKPSVFTPSIVVSIMSALVAFIVGIPSVT